MRANPNQSEPFGDYFSILLTDEQVDELVRFLVEAYQRSDVMNVIRQLMNVPASERERVLEALSEWDVVEAVSFAQIVKGRLAVIDQFEHLLLSGAPEKVPDRDDLQGFLATHPWVIDATWTLMAHERGLDTMLVEHFKLKKSKTEEARQRIDFFCLSDTNNVVIVEIKGAKIDAGKDEIRQLVDYVDFFREQEAGRTSDPRRPKKHILGCLIARKLKDNAMVEATSATARGIFFRSWDSLADIARHSNKAFYDVVRSRANSNDPRLKLLEEGTSDEAEATAGDSSATVELSDEWENWDDEPSA